MDDKERLEKLKKIHCPLCNNKLVFIYGNGLQLDRLACSARRCNYTKELTTSNTPQKSFLKGQEF